GGTTRGAKTCHGPLPCACESDVALPQSCQRDVPRSYFVFVVAAAMLSAGISLRRSILPSVRIACPRSIARATLRRPERQRRETSPPQISASGSGCCVTSGGIGLGKGTSLSISAGALDRAVRTSRRDGHYCAAHRAMVVGAAGSAIRHRKSPGCRQQCWHRGGRARGSRRLYAWPLRRAECDQRNALRQAQFQF